jgi:formylmethanofuran dehydrogenase subunit E
MKRSWIALALCLGLGCAGAVAPHAASPPERADERALASVAAIHGGAGPWAVAGYRMGEAALRQLGLERGSFDLEITHYTPPKVQYSCIADGAAASTGASLGKLNLTLSPASAEETRTTYRRRSTGQTLTLRLRASFEARFLDVPYERFAEAARDVLHLPEAEIFEAVP